MAEFGDDLAYAKKKLIQARIDDGDTYPVFQPLILDGGQDDIFLLQLNSEVMDQFEAGNSLIIRGEVDEPAVICTKSKTFELKEAETSNSLLLIPDLKFPDDACDDSEETIERKKVSGLFHTYYEMRSIRPSFKKLRSLLEGSAYRGKEYENDPDSYNKFTIDQLLNVIQCSEDELRSELIELQTCIVDGYVRTLDSDYKFGIFSQILNVIESMSMPINKISKELIIQALEELEPRDILEACFSWFTEETDSLNEETGSKFYRFKEHPVCVLHAEILLQSSGKFHLQDFLESWQRSVPEGLTCSLDQLRGLVLIDSTSRPPVISYFPYHNLSENISERFEFLFRIRDKWSYDDIVPFLEDRASAGTNVKALLIKYTRESTKNGVKFYSSKW